MAFSYVALGEMFPSSSFALKSSRSPARHISTNSLYCDSDNFVAGSDFSLGAGVSSGVFLPDVPEFFIDSLMIVTPTSVRTSFMSVLASASKGTARATAHNATTHRDFFIR